MLSHFLFFSMGGIFFPHFLIDLTFMTFSFFLSRFKTILKLKKKQLRRKPNKRLWHICQFQTILHAQPRLYWTSKTTLFHVVKYHSVFLFRQIRKHILKEIFFQFGRCVYQIYRLVNGNKENICCKDNSTSSSLGHSANF